MQRRWVALGAVMLAVMAVGMDITILNVALPTLAGAFHASESSLEWFSSAYTLAMVAALLPAGFVGDRYGRKRTMVLSLALFGAGSVLCALAPSAAVFTLARVVVGAAGAGVAIMALTALLVLFDAAERPRAVSAWAAFNFIALPVGPVVGGWILAHFFWGWVFLMNVPVALLGLGTVVWLVPETRASGAVRLDLVGLAAAMSALLALTYGLIEAGQHGWTSGAALAEMAAGLVLGGAFWLWERRAGRTPGGAVLVDWRLLRSPEFSWGVALLFLLTVPMIGLLFTMPQYFQAILGVSAEGSGLRLVVVVAGLVVGAGLSARLSAAGMRRLVAAGFAVLSVGLAMGAFTRDAPDFLYVGAWMAVAGVGLGMSLTQLVSGALSALSADQGGPGSALLQVLKNLGAPFGSAVLGSVLASTYQRGLLTRGLPPPLGEAARQSVFGALAVARRLGAPALATAARHAFVHGMDLALAVSAAVAVVGAVTAARFLPARAAPAHPALESHGAVGTAGVPGR